MFDRVPATRFIVNSLVISFITVGLGLFVNSLAGFSLSRMRWRGQRVAMTIIIATLIVPFETIAVPLLLVVNHLPWISISDGIKVETGWLNSYHVQILPFVANAFSIFLFAQFFKTIPRELDEAARVDGASWFYIYRKLIVPLSGPVFATVAILTFLPIWNQYLWPLMVTQDEDIRPVMVGTAVLLPAQHRMGRDHGLLHDDHGADPGAVPRPAAGVHPEHRPDRGEGMTRRTRAAGRSTSRRRSAG